MFTGIIEEIGRIESITRSTEGGMTLHVVAHKVMEGVRIGDSIATDGVCLTVRTMTSKGFMADVMEETIRMTNFKDLVNGSNVNLERAMKAGSRFDGHMVSGHIDGVGTITQKKQEGNALWVGIRLPKGHLHHVILKGSVAIDGTSLTIARIEEDVIWVSLIPHTRDQATLAERMTGETVNLEFDVIAKYVERMLTFMPKDTSNDTNLMELLNANGFMR